MTEFEKQLMHALTICRYDEVDKCAECLYDKIPFSKCEDKLHKDLLDYLTATIMDRDEEGVP